MKHTLIWLLLLGSAAAVFYRTQNHVVPESMLIHASTPHNRTFVENDNPLQYLNRLRRQLGLVELAHSPELENAARRHARYLTHNPEDGHGETNPGNPHYTAHQLTERTRLSGYLYNGVHENVSTDEIEAEQPDGEALAAQRQLDGLLTAIYHRLSLLDQHTDEAGAAFVRENGRSVLVFNQGNSRFNRHCGLDRKEAQPERHYYRNACHNGAVVYTDEVAQQERLYTVYPVGNGAVPYFHGERPDPMPGYEMTGNPVSIDFAEAAGKVKMHSFKLYRDDVEIKAVKILDRRNDPNQRLSAHQFALFPLQPLEYDTVYQAKFDYSLNGQRTQAQWQFQTKKPDYPYFTVQGGEALAVEAGKKYLIHWQNRWCLKHCSHYTYRQQISNSLTVHRHEAGGVIVSADGMAGSRITLTPNDQPDRSITLYIR